MVLGLLNSSSYKVVRREERTAGGLNEKCAIELIDLEVFRSLCFFVVRPEAEVLVWRGADKIDLTSWDVAGSIFDGVISGRARPKAGKLGVLGSVNLEIACKIQILEHVDCRESHPGADNHDREDLANHGWTI